MAKILIVDDDPDILKFAERVLSDQNHWVYTADSAMGALELLDQSHFDLLLSDAKMPHYSGFDLIKTVKHNQKFQNLPIAMLTGLREKKHIDEAIKMGVDDYILKPIDPFLLTQKVASLFKDNPPVDLPELLLNSNQINNKASILLTGEIQKISELGLTLKSQNQLSIGQLVNLKCEMFENMNCEIPQLKVTHIKQQHDDVKCFLITMIFLGATERFLQNIRSLIFSRTSLRSKRVS